MYSEPDAIDQEIARIEGQIAAATLDDSVRPARTDDLDDLVAMGAKFFLAARLGRWFHFDPHCFIKVVADLMASDRAVVLIGEEPIGAVAMAAAMAYPCWFDVGHLTAQELFWWVEPEHRGSPLGAELRQGLEDWARSKGCSTMEMGALETLRPEALTALYARKGFDARERTFIKRLV